MSVEDGGDILKLARSGGISFVGSAAGRLLWLLTQVIVARFLGVEVFGLFILGLVAIKLAEIIARFGLLRGIFQADTVANS